MPQTKPLSESFSVMDYRLIKTHKNDIVTLIIEGRRVGRPSKRISLHQKNLKITAAHIISAHKNKVIEYHIQRINHLPKLQEVRIHTAQILYPGNYTVTLSFQGDIKNLESVLAQDIENIELRAHLPCIDEQESKTNATFNLG